MADEKEVVVPLDELFGVAVLKHKYESVVIEPPEFFAAEKAAMDDLTKSMDLALSVEGSKFGEAIKKASKSLATFIDESILKAAMGSLKDSMVLSHVINRKYESGGGMYPLTPGSIIHVKAPDHVVPLSFHPDAFKMVTEGLMDQKDGPQAAAISQNLRAHQAVERVESFGDPWVAPEVWASLPRLYANEIREHAYDRIYHTCVYCGWSEMRALGTVNGTVCAGLPMQEKGAAPMTRGVDWATGESYIAQLEHVIKVGGENRVVTAVEGLKYTVDKPKGSKLMVVNLGNWEVK